MTVNHINVDKRVLMEGYLRIGFGSFLTANRVYLYNHLTRVIGHVENWKIFISVETRTHDHTHGRGSLIYLRKKI